MSAKSKVTLTLLSASDILAADKGGTSDAYATAELVYTDTGKALNKARKTKTKTIKKTLSPVWNEGEVVWADIEEDIETISLKVTLFDADMMSSDTLGGVNIPLSSLKHDMNGSERRTFPLETVGKMKETATGTVCFQCSVDDAAAAAEAAAASSPAPEPATAAPAEAPAPSLSSDATTPADAKAEDDAAKDSAADAATKEGEAKAADSSSEIKEASSPDKPPPEAMDKSGSATILVALLSASGILAADKGGTSDAYATAELVYTDTGKALNKARKTKTKTIKKTLSPVWNEGEVVWPDINEDIETISLKVTLLDADMMSSTSLGGVTIPLVAGLDSEDSYPLSKVGKMKQDAKGSVKVRLRVRLTATPGEKEEAAAPSAPTAAPRKAEAPRDAPDNITAPVLEAPAPPDLEQSAPPPPEEPDRSNIWRKNKRPEVLHTPTWQERLELCEKRHASERLDFSRLKLGNQSFGPGTETSMAFTKMGLKNTLLNLNLKGNNLTEFPKSLCIGFPNLETLVLSYNQLSDLPDEISHLHNLALLAIDHNVFKELPLCLYSPSLKTSLVKLNAAANQLKSLPEGQPFFGGMLVLESLLLADNSLMALPRELAVLAEDHALEEMDLTNNPVVQDDSDFFIPRPLQKILNKREATRSKARRQQLMKRGSTIAARVKAKLEANDTIED